VTFDRIGKKVGKDVRGGIVVLGFVGGLVSKMFRTLGSEIQEEVR
jgi:tetrahydromethanopterin S-methyltransferase subunit G